MNDVIKIMEAKKYYYGRIHIISTWIILFLMQFSKYFFFKKGVVSIEMEVALWTLLALILISLLISYKKG